MLYHVSEFQSWINNKGLLYSTGNYIQYSGINHNGKEYFLKIYLYVQLNHFVVQKKLIQHCNQWKTNSIPFLKLNNIPLFPYTTFCLFYMSVDIWFVFSFWLLWITLPWTLMYKCLSLSVLSVLLGVYSDIYGEGNGTPLQYSCLENPMDGGAWWAAVPGVAEGQTRLSDFTFTFHFHALEKEMATHSSVLAWRIPGVGEPGGLSSMGSHRVGHDWSDLAVTFI